VTFFPSLGEPGDAAVAIALRNGEQRAGLDVTLSRGFNISGTVVTKEEARVASVLLVSRNETDVVFR
jgi:hypothetical protein